MAGATIRFDGFATLEQNLQKLSDAAAKEVLQAGLAAGGEVLRAGIAGRIHSRTGKTAAAIQVIQTSPETVEIGTPRSTGVFWLPSLEKGARPHRIPKGGRGRRRAATSKVLRLPGGVFRATVQHPGIRPQYPMTRTLAEDGETAVRETGRAMWDGLKAVAASLPGGAA